MPATYKPFYNYSAGENVVDFKIAEHESSSGGFITDVVNVGAGSDIVKGLVGTIIEIKGLQSSAGLDWSGDADNLQPTINLTSFPAGLDALKIGSGLVSNTELNHISNLTSSAVGETDAQTLTFKTLDDVSNDVKANKLATNTLTLDLLQGEDPVEGNVLTKFTDNSTRWSNPRSLLLTFGATWLDTEPTPINLMINGNGLSPVVSAGDFWLREAIMPYNTEVTKVTWMSNSPVPHLTLQVNVAGTSIPFIIPAPTGIHTFVLPIPASVNDLVSVQVTGGAFPVSGINLTVNLYTN